MSYDIPRYPMTYSLAYQFVWTTTDKIIPIVGPKGTRGRIIDLGVFGVTAAFAGATTTPKIKAGTTSGGAELVVAFDFGALSVATGGKSIRSTYSAESDIAAVILNDGKIAADATSYVDMVVATGGGAAGTSNAFALIYWGA